MANIVTIQRRAETAHCARLLPIWFLAFTLLAATAPGHGWQLFAIGAIPGVWAAFLFGAGEGLLGWLAPTLIVGVPMMWFLGRLLDRLYADVRLWLIAAVLTSAAAGFLMLQSYTHLDSAFERHGSFWAFLFCSLQLGSYGATLLLLVLPAGRRS